MLGASLRRLREQKGLTREVAGFHIRASESKISRMELGRVGFKTRDVEDLLTLYGVVDGVYTGRLLSEFCYGPGKVGRVRRLAEEKGYDLRLCYAYSDSRSDLPLLEMVGHPVAVNPDATLRRIARERNWPVVSFARKAKRTATAVGSGVAVAGLGAGLYALGRVHGRRQAG